jgi:hypothetical protein
MQPSAPAGEHTLLESIATCEKKVFAAWLPICKVNYP